MWKAIRVWRLVALGGISILGLGFLGSCDNDEESVNASRGGDGALNLSLSEPPTYVCEDDGVLTFTLTLNLSGTDSLRTATTIEFTIGGTATYEEDYALEASELIREDDEEGSDRTWLATLLPLTHTLNISFRSLADDEEDDDETLIFTVKKINGIDVREDEAIEGTSTLKQKSDWDGDQFIDLCSPAHITSINDDPNGKYELSADIDFANQGSFRPIEKFNGILEGNGYSLLNLSIGKARLPSSLREVSGLIGTFGNESASAEIRNLGIIGVDINHTSQNGIAAGALIAEAHGGSVRNCFVRGTSLHKRVKGRPAGGLIGVVVGSRPVFKVENVYVVGVDIENGATSKIPVHGGFLGNITNKGESSFKYCYTVTNGEGARDLTQTGGLIGSAPQDVLSHSHWDSEDKANAIGRGDNGEAVVGLTKEEFRCPMGPDDTDCKDGATVYETWNSEYWDFGSSTQFPILKTTRGGPMRNQGREAPAEEEESDSP